MTVSIDDLDRQILAMLQRDGRTSYVDMASALGAAESTIRRRVDRLRSEGIAHIYAWVDPFKLGMATVAFVNLDVDVSCLEQAAQALADMPYVRLVAFSTGRHNLFAEVLLPSQEDLLVFMKEALPQIPGIRQVETGIILQIHKRAFQWEIPNARLEQRDPRTAA